MKLSVYKSYDDLPLFLNARMVAQVLGVSISTAYELLNDPGFPTLRVGSRMVSKCGVPDVSVWRDDAPASGVRAGGILPDLSAAVRRSLQQATLPV